MIKDPAGSSVFGTTKHIRHNSTQAGKQNRAINTTPRGRPFPGRQTDGHGDIQYLLRRDWTNLKGLDFAGVSDVGSAAEIDERAASIGRRPVRLNLLLDDAALEGIVGEEIEKLPLRQDASLERLLLLQNRFYHVFDGFEVVT